MKDKLGTPRPWLFRAIRGLEMLGLVALMYGLASSRWLIAVGGALLIAASYQIFRGRFPLVDRKDDGSMGMSDGD